MRFKTTTSDFVKRLSMLNLPIHYVKRHPSNERFSGIMNIRIASFVMFALFSATPIYAKFALLVGVSVYDNHRLNDPALRYSEKDAEAIKNVLEGAGYQVTLLTGDKATKDSIHQAMKDIEKLGNTSDVLILGFFGHGVQYDESAYYCPYDTKMRVATDDDGKEQRNNAGLLQLEPDPDSMVSMLRMLDAMRISNAGSKLLIADCCRNDPSKARGLVSRAFGEKLQVSQLPSNSAAMFACSAGEQAYEDSEWEHGAFTKAILEVIPTKPLITANGLSESVYFQVDSLVRKKGKVQRVNSILTGGVIDLKFDPDRPGVSNLNASPSMRSSNDPPNLLGTSSETRQMPSSLEGESDRASNPRQAQQPYWNGELPEPIAKKLLDRPVWRTAEAQAEVFQANNGEWYIMAVGKWKLSNRSPREACDVAAHGKVLEALKGMNAQVIKKLNDDGLQKFVDMSAQGRVPHLPPLAEWESEDKAYISVLHGMKIEQ
ncbi:caspase family protein [Pirellulaceae bacterium SH449]